MTRLLHLAAAGVVVAGVAATLFRPVAPDPGPVPDPSTWFDAAHLARVEAYRAPQRLAALAALVVAVAVPAAAALTGPGRHLVGRLVALADGGGHPVRAGALVALAVTVAADLVALPVAYWAGYVHEGAFGFRTQGLASWAADWLVTHAPVWAGAAAVAAAGVALARRLDVGTWPAVAGLAAAAATAVVVLVAPLVLEPLQFRFTPLPDGPVRQAVQDVLDRAGEDIDRIVVADASRRTTKENAYVSGLGATRQVVLYDTLVANRTPEEVAAVFAHELGHHRNADLPRGVALGAAATVAAAYSLAALLGGRGLSDPRAVAAAAALVAVLTVAALPVQSLVSRRLEAAADHAALGLTADPRAFLALQEGLALANLSDPAPPRWAVVLWATHPSPAERLAATESWLAADEAWEAGLP